MNRTLIVCAALVAFVVTVLYSQKPNRPAPVEKMPAVAPATTTSVAPRVYVQARCRYGLHWAVGELHTVRQYQLLIEAHVRPGASSFTFENQTPRQRFTFSSPDNFFGDTVCGAPNAAAFSRAFTFTVP